MRTKTLLLAVFLLTMLGCVDQIEYNITGKVDIIVVDGRITNLEEEQIVKLFRSKADPITGRFGSAPVLGAKMELVVNGSQKVAFVEDTTILGNYHLPKNYIGAIGNTYQLRFQLIDGTIYESSIEKMQSVPAMENIDVRFNANEEAETAIGFKGFHELYIDTKDPTDEKNFYSWEWVLYEKQPWCRSCLRGVYAVYKIIPGQYLFRQYFVSGTELFEDCFAPQPVYDNPEAPIINRTDWTYDYECRTKCWEVIRNNSLNLFEDSYTNGGQITHRKVAKIPFYQRGGCLVELRQLSLNKDAYEYYKLFQQQTENSGGIADTPPTALRGNVKNVANAREVVVGYFSASAVSSKRQWIDRKDTGGTIPPGLFEALTGRIPNPEPPPPYDGPRGEALVKIWGGPPRVPTALCLKTNNRTPTKPEGWRDDN